ncbi:MAG: tRNA uridine-5-carboxymethylaminomethyl(34) synthesis GTPase MnmE [Thermomicrobiales bacterium]|nr:tRNA uridine-5-carboxymethylaminomethyl(34) synthesis GTPase MnmE [Thermomicrobiales bacterium]
MPLDFATIAAISTPPGVGGIGVIRISGAGAAGIASHLFVRANGSPVDLRSVTSHRVLFGEIRDPGTGALVDEVLLTWMAAPHTYTTEDTVEISCHGGQLPLQETLRVVLAAGARHAEPGEFTLRAFLHGRLDLSQAESVLNVIDARTAEGLRLAVEDLQGELSRRIAPARQAVISLLAFLDAAADFPEDEIPGTDIDADLATAIAALDDVIAGSRAGMLFRDGAQVALVGRPNVGKSSLMNALLRSDRAIVTSIAGTTRDVITESCNIHGISVTLIDTAGIAETEDIVERLGIERSQRALATAGAAILVLDGSIPPADDDLAVARLLADRVDGGHNSSPPPSSSRAKPTDLLASRVDRGHDSSPLPSSSRAKPRDLLPRQFSEQRPLSSETTERSVGGTRHDESRADAPHQAPIVIAINKRDLPQTTQQAVIDILPGAVGVEVSSMTGAGIADLESALAAVLGQNDVATAQPSLITTRQRAALERALTHLREAHATRIAGFPIDLMATDVRAALHAIGEVTGENVDEEVLTEIFSRFCIGK